LPRSRRWNASGGDDVAATLCEVVELLGDFAEQLDDVASPSSDFVSDRGKLVRGSCDVDYGSGGGGLTVVVVVVVTGAGCVVTVVVVCAGGGGGGVCWMTTD
jgi:hypothetical protein